MDDALGARTRCALKPSIGRTPDVVLSTASGRRPAVKHIEPDTLEEIMSRVQRTDDVALESSFASSDKRTLTDVEVAVRLGVSRFTVRSWRLKGVGPRFLKMGRAVRYRPQDVDEYERQALVDPQTESDRTPV
jgi:predicted DNA-binding transcriptional regulator AlpA